MADGRGRRAAHLLPSGRWPGRERLLLLAARALVRLKIEGEERIPPQGPCLFPFNHASPPADLLVNLVIRRRRPDVHVFAAQVLAGQNPLAAFLARVGDDDAQARLLRAYKAAGLSGGELVRAYRILRAGGAVAIAAEGELTWDGRLQHPLAPGAAWLALRTGAPVVPVVSIGGYDLRPRWQMDRLHLPGRLAIRVGGPFTLSAHAQERTQNQDVEEASERLWQALARLLGRAETPAEHPT